MLSVVVPRFENVTVCGALLDPTTTVPNWSRLEESDTSAPTPLKLTVCGLMESPSTSVSVPVRDPLAVGVKVTVMMH